jgi:lactoylglutathione lyase
MIVPSSLLPIRRSVAALSSLLLISAASSRCPGAQGFIPKSNSPISAFSLAMSSSSAQQQEKKGVSSYLSSDTYNSLPKDGEVIFLHTMIRSMDLQRTMDFFEAIGLRETRRKESQNGRFTLVFMASSPGAPEIEITYNWDPEVFAEPSRSMGHLAYGVDDIYALCESLQSKRITILRPPRDGRMAFVKR